MFRLLVVLLFCGIHMSAGVVGTQAETDSARYTEIRRLIQRNRHISAHLVRAVDARTIKAVRRRIKAEDIAVLVRMMGDKDYGVASAASSLLVTLGEQAEPALRQAASAKDVSVSIHAQDALRLLRDCYDEALRDVMNKDVCPSDRSAGQRTSVSIVLVPRERIFTQEEVQRGAVSFTALIRNEGSTTIKVAHPSICLPRDYRQGDVRRLNDSHGKSEILLKIEKPDGSNVILRDGYLHFFDPGNVPVLTIPPGGTGAFQTGWFFLNARGRWERDDLAANVFLEKGQYTVGILFRNVFPRAALYNEKAKATRFIDVWTGEMKSPEITIEVK